MAQTAKSGLQKGLGEDDKWAKSWHVATGEDRWKETGLGKTERQAEEYHIRL